MTEPRKLRVFLCHSSHDKPVVRGLYQHLLAEGWIDPWLDEEKLLPGQDWDIEIEKAVEAADAVIVCLSNNSVTKEGYVQKELRFVLNVAMEKPEGAIFIIPLRFNDCLIPRTLRSIQYIDYYPDTRKTSAYERLIASFQLHASVLKINLPNAFSGSSNLLHTIHVTEKYNTDEAKNQTNNRYNIRTDSSITIASAPETFLALHQLPSPPADFTGREKELERLRIKLKKFEERDNEAIIVSVQGMAGVGKTALALKLANEIKDGFPDGQFFLDLRGVDDKNPLTPEEVMKHVILSLHPEQKIYEDDQQIAGLYRSLLHKKRALLLWDNVRDANQIKPLLIQGCLTLVTSRQNFTLPGLDSLDLEAFTVDEAKNFFMKIVPSVKLSDVEEISVLCNQIPLALRLAASTLRERPDISVSLYIENLKKKQNRLSLVETSIQLSYDLLDEDLRLRFQKLGVFVAPFEFNAVKTVWNDDVETSEDALGTLLRYNLISFDKANETYYLHDLICFFAISKLSESVDDVLDTVKNFANYYLPRITRDNSSFDAHTDVDEDFSKKTRIYLLREKNSEAARRYMLKGWRDNDLLRPMNADDWLLPGRGFILEFPNRFKNIEVTVGDWRQMSGKSKDRNYDDSLRYVEFWKEGLELEVDLKTKLTLLVNLANSYSWIDTAKAIEYYEKAIDIARKTHDLFGEAKLLENLSASYGKLGKGFKAKKFQAESANILEAAEIEQKEIDQLADLGLSYIAEYDEDNLVFRDTYTKVFQILNRRPEMVQFYRNAKDKADIDSFSLYSFSHIASASEMRYTYGIAVEKYKILHDWVENNRSLYEQIENEKEQFEKHKEMVSVNQDAVEVTVAACKNTDKYSLISFQKYIEEMRKDELKHDLAEALSKIVFKGARIEKRLTFLLDKDEQIACVREILHRLR